TRSYIRHLFKAKEMLALRPCVLHNLYFYNKLMEDIRKALDEDRFHEFKENKLSEWSRGQEPVEK
uniref:tRNA-guanine transglycosylase n=1 Tax=Proteiniclasticum sp. TaxID=2053595 RepID=UPI00289A6DA4